MEELRPFLVDRLALTMVNLQQIRKEDFYAKEDGGVIMTERGRKEVLSSWQKRKQEEITHPYLNEVIPIGLIPYAQAMLMSRYLRGDIDGYPPYFMSWGATMMVLVTYDVNTVTPEGQRRLRQVAKECKDYGQRVQNSVFECMVDPAQFFNLRQSLIEIMDQEVDSLRFYFLGDNWQKRVEHYGAKKGYDPEGMLIA